LSSSPIALLAVADIHAPKYLELFSKSVSSLSTRPDLVLLAGDVIYKGRAEEVLKVVDVLTKKFKDVRIIACFGNEEYDQVKGKLKELTKGVVEWLDDEAIELELKGKVLGIVGTRGSLDRPTRWQRAHVPNIEQIYKSRVDVVKEKLLSLSSCDYKILLTHYAPTHKTLVGEPKGIWPELGCKAFEQVISETKPTLVVHGHAHNSKVNEAWIGSTLVVNVSLPSRKGVCFLEVPPKRQVGLLRFAKWD